MITNSLGARIKEKRNEAGLSQEYFAELLGIVLLERIVILGDKD